MNFKIFWTLFLTLQSTFSTKYIIPWTKQNISIFDIRINTNPNHNNNNYSSHFIKIYKFVKMKLFYPQIILYSIINSAKYIGIIQIYLKYCYPSSY